MMTLVQQGSAKRRIQILRILGVAGAALILWLTFRNVNVPGVAQLLQSTGPFLLLALLPQLVANLIDTYAWADIMGRAGVSVPFRGAFIAHLASEATRMSLPLGVVVSEPLRPYLLHRRDHVPIPDAVASTAARKYLIMAAEGLVIALAAALSFKLLADLSVPVIGVPGLHWAAWGVAVVLLGTAGGYAWLLRNGSLAERGLRFVKQFSPAAWREKLEEKRQQFLEVDGSFSKYFSLPWSQLAPGTAMYTAVWLLEALETYVILTAIGVDVSFAAALALESVLVFVRSIVAVLPSGLGLQDLGYVLFLRALGIQDALLVGAAFSLIKRLKEALWIAVGYACLFFGQRRSASPIEVSA
jgi:uncharacterized protein (TIRG00374 family)